MALFLMHLCNFLVAQNTFSRYYNTYKGNPYGNEYGNNLIITDDGYCINTASICMTPEINACGNLLFTDRSGNIKWSKHFSWFCDGDRETLVEHNDTIYYAGTKDYNHRRDGDAYIIKLNSAGDSLGLMHDYFQDSYNKFGVPVSMVYLEDHLYTINHHDAFNEQNIPELIKWDLSGNKVLDTLYYEEIGRVAYSYGLITTKDKNLIIVYVVRNENDDLNAELLKVDQNGKKLWKKSIDSKDIVPNPRIMELPDSSLVMQYFYKIQDWDSIVSGWAEHPLLLMKLSKDGKKELWRYQFDRNPGYIKGGSQLLIPAKNGDIIGAGGYSSAYFDDGYNGEPCGLGWIFRMSPDGELLWEHFYQDEGFPGHQSLLSVREDYDGSIVAVGEKFFPDSMAQDNFYTWVLKVDSNGCLTPGCTPQDTIQYITSVIEEVLPPDIKANIYPNPVVDNLYVESLDDSFVFRKWSIYDLLGQCVSRGSFESKGYIPVRGLSSGIYILKLENRKGIGFVSKFVKE